MQRIRKVNKSKHYFRPNCEPLEPRRVLATILGVGTTALIGNDLTDPENDIVDDVNDGAGANFNWVSVASSSETYFSPGGPSRQGALDVFDNKVGLTNDVWCCDGPEPEQWVAVEFDRPYTLTHFTIAAGDAREDRDPDVWQIQGSNDGEAWTTIFAYDQDGTSPFSERLEVVRFDGNQSDFATPAPYHRFRYLVTSIVDRTRHQLNELELFGFSGLQVVQVTPGLDEIVSARPEYAIVDFTVDVNPATVDGGDLTIDGTPATSATIVDSDTIQFGLPALPPGTHRLAIDQGAISPADAIHADVSAFSSTFIVPEPAIIENTSVTDLLADSATIGAHLVDDQGTMANVTILWGTEDGETDQAAWQNAIDLGDLSNNIYRQMIDGLTPETGYFYRAATMNAGGESWAPATSSFTTTPLTVPALSVGQLDFVSATAATISGQVTNTGGDVPNVVVYYGTTDGGTDPAAWQNSIDVGERRDNFATSISRLLPETKYFFAAAGTNSAGSVWSGASRSFSTRMAPRVRISEFMAVNSTVLTTRVRADESVEFSGVAETPDWIEIENLTDAPLDLSGSFLTDNPGDTRQWQFPAGTMVPASGRTVVFLSGQDVTNPSLDEQGLLHTNFGLNADGEYLALVSRDGETLFEYDPYPGQETDVSFGVVDGLPQYFVTPTPGEPNNPETLELVDDTTFSVDRGFYDEPIFVEIGTDTLGATIHYTLDGSAPSDTHGEVYSNPLLIDRTTTLRAVAFKPGLRASNVDTQSYFFIDDVITQSEESTLAAGFPALWGRTLPDYGMDPDVIGPNDQFEGRYAATIKDDLVSLPSLSIVTDVDDMFGSDGIYTNPQNNNLEVPASIEMITADGGEEFQINAGIKIQGGAFRSWDLTKKKSFRLKFKSEYGPSKLNYPLFGPDAVSQFDTLTLRMEANDGWQWAGATGQPQYARDEFGRRVQLAMGHPASHGRNVHVYLNGVYWGMYNAVERPDQSFAESYLGSDKEDWDGINSGQPINAGDDADRRSRTSDAWKELVRLSQAVREGTTEAERTAALMRMQGLNADGSNNPDRSSYLDVTNYIDYMIINFYGGNTDWPRKNYYLGRENATDSEGFKFFMWDAEWSLFMRNNIDTSVVDDPAGVGLPFQNLRFSEAFRLMFADRVQQQLFHGGPLYVDPENPNWDPEHPERNVPAATYVGVVEEVFDGLVAESARWGDQHRADRPYTRDDEWQVEFDRLITEWFPQRTAKLLGHFIDGNLFPELQAPEFQINGQDQHGGPVSSGDVLTMTSQISEITSDLTLVDESSLVKIFLPTDNTLEEGQPSWSDPNFDANDWTDGVNGVGFENRPRDFTHLIKTDIREAWEAQRTSVYLRYEFELPDDFDPANFDRLKLRMSYDDGFVAYINGQIALSDTVQLPVNFDSNATDQRRDDESAEPIDFQIDEGRNSLRPGKNVLAVHGFNKSDTSSDMLFLPVLILSKIETISPAPIYFTTDGSDPRAMDGSAVGTLYAEPFAVDETTSIRARALLGSVWSPLDEVTFAVNKADASNLLISEINYNPAPPTDSEFAMRPTLDNDDFEFVEIHNPTDASISLAGLRFTAGIEYEFPSIDLGPKDYSVIAKDASAFAARYGDQIELLGEFAGGSLANGGERLAISTSSGQTIVDFGYRDGDPWPVRTDGAGGTLQLVDLNPANASQFDKSSQWRGSTLYNGSPGRADATPSPIVINEVLANTGLPLVRSDSIELHNPTSDPIDISGWYLSDSADDLLKFRIPDGTLVDAGSYLIFDETHFNPDPVNAGPNDFALGGNRGDDVWLVIPDASGQVGQFVDDVHFTGTPLGRSLGRLPNGSGRLVPMESSFGSTNSHWLPSSVAITEVHYSPATPSEASLAIAPSLGASDLEFIELYNNTDAAIDLTNWRLRGGIDFDIPSGTMLGSGSTLVMLSFNPVNRDNADRLAAFRAEFGIDESVALVGGFRGRLDNSEDLVKLQLPGESSASDPDFIPRILEDEVLYDNLEPWPLRAAGQGESLHRSNLFANGNASASWRSAAPSPGGFDAPVLGDFTADDIVDANDIHLLCNGVRDANSAFDLNGDGATSLADLDLLIESVLGTSIADVNLDGVFDSRDLVSVFQAGEYEDQITLNSNWEHGDWNCDGDFTSRDIVRAFTRGSYVAAARAVDQELSDVGSALSSEAQPRDSTSWEQPNAFELKPPAAKRAAWLEFSIARTRPQLVDRVFLVAGGENEGDEWFHKI